MQDTIFALSSGRPPSGIAIIRMSGPDVRMAFDVLCGSVPSPRSAKLDSIRFRNGELIDRGLVLFFPAPHSFTGEDCGELHLHGGRAVVTACLNALAELPGFRSAEAGEFTRRAFGNGKLDLTAIEGLADLIHAETEEQRRMAVEQAGGALAALYAGWAKRLTLARAMIEADMDFSDEEDVPGAVTEQTWDDLRALDKEIARHLSGVHWGEVVREGFRVALVGRPNVGKSTLLNRLADRDVAIVSDEPGTTRDVIEVRMDIGGYLVLFQDTAGMRESASKVEREGVRRSYNAVELADLVLLLDDGSQEGEGVEISHRNVIRVQTKSDLAPAHARANKSDLAVSALTGEGIGTLVGLIRDRISDLAVSDGLTANRVRHRVLLEECRKHMCAALEDDDIAQELKADSLRLAANSLGRITGRVDVEDLLDVIFSEFCIGK